MNGPFEIAGRTVLVTGGSAGIGLAMTRHMLRARADRIIVVGRDPARLEAIVAEGAGRVTPMLADLADPAAVDRLIAAVSRSAPDLSVVINNAGTQQLMDLVGDDPDWHLPVIRKEIAVNLSGVIALSVGLLPVLGGHGSAALINITSGLALAPKKSSPVYCATKAAVRSFTRALRYQCEDALPNVRVIEALPPLVDTAMTRGRGRGKMSPEACAAEILAGLRSGRQEIHVGKSKLLRAIMRLAPSIGYQIMRHG